MFKTKYTKEQYFDMLNIARGYAGVFFMLAIGIINGGHIWKQEQNKHGN